MFDKASRKLGLDKAVLQSMNTDQGKHAAGGNSLGLSKADIEELLKKGEEKGRCGGGVVGCGVVKCSYLFLSFLHYFLRFLS